MLRRSVRAALRQFPGCHCPGCYSPGGRLDCSVSGAHGGGVQVEVKGDRAVGRHRMGGRFLVLLLWVVTAALLWSGLPRGLLLSGRRASSLLDRPFVRPGLLFHLLPLVGVLGGRDLLHRRQGMLTTREFTDSDGPPHALGSLRSDSLDGGGPCAHSCLEVECIG